MEPGKIDLTRLIRSEAARPTIAVVAGIALIAALQFGAVAPLSMKLQRLQLEIGALREKAARYRDFSSFQPKLDPERGRVTQYLAPYERVLGLRADSEQAFLDEMVLIGKQVNIKLDRAAPTIDRRHWEIDFSAPFGTATQFLSVLEEHFVVDSLSVANGRHLPAHVIKMTISPLALSLGKVESLPVSGDFIETFQAVQEKLTAFDAAAGRTQRFTGITRDPLRFTGTILPEEKSAAKAGPVAKKVVEGPPVVLGDIFWDPALPIAVVNGKATKEGESVGETTIVKINEKDVVVQWRSKKFTLKRR